MTTLYKPVLIETVKQAEALPGGTVAILGWGLGSDIRTRTKNGWITRTGSVLPSNDVIGWTALVPVEAEEEAVACGDDWSIPTHEGLMPNGDVVPNGWSVHARYVTPWEEV